MKLLTDYRRAMSEIELDGYEFGTLPKDLMEPRNIITVLLKEIHRHFQPKLLPTALFQRNTNLKGNLRILRVKTFGQDEVSHKGESKVGWRLAILEGDFEFMDKLREIPEDYRFHLGSGHVYLRGGERAHSKNKAKTSYKLNDNQNLTALGRRTAFSQPIDRSRNWPERKESSRREETRHRERSTSSNRNYNVPHSSGHRPRSTYTQSHRPGITQENGARPKDTRPRIDRGNSRSRSYSSARAAPPTSPESRKELSKQPPKNYSQKK